MKVSEAIKKLNVGDEVWVKGKVVTLDAGTKPLQAMFQGDGSWIGKDDEISLVEPKQDKPVVKPFDEPQAEKVEVPDFVAELIRKYKAKKETLFCSIANIYRESDEYKWYVDNAEIYERAWANGYTVKPKQWIVKYIPPFIDDFRYYSMDDEIFDITESSWTSDKEKAYTFNDKKKAEALALLVEGSVEEV